MKLRALDVETNGTQREYGLQPWRVRTGDAWLTSIATCGAGSDLPQVWRQPDLDTLRGILRAAIADGVTLVAWNAAFDIAWLIALGLGELVRANSWLDGMLVYKAVHNAPGFVSGSVQSFGLKSAVATHAGAMAQFAGYGDNAVFNPQTEAEWDELLNYNKLDALFTHRLTVENLAKLSAGQVRAVTIEAACLPMVAEANVDGIWANMGEAATLSEALRLTAAESLGSLVATSDVTAEQLASPKQLGVLLYDTWGLTCPKLTEKGANSTDKEALDALAVQDDRADLVR